MWRVTNLIRRAPETPAVEWPTRLLETLAPALEGAVGGDRRLSRLAMRVTPAALDPAVSSIFPPLFDGQIELWFKSAEDAVAVMRLLAADSGVRSRAAGLIDGSAGVGWLAEVFPRKTDRTRKVNVTFLAGGEAAEGWSVEAAQAYWRDVHPVVAETAPDVWGPLVSYVQFHSRDMAGFEIPDWLARGRFVPMCAEMGFVEQQDFVRNYSCEQYRTIVRPDEEKFSRPGEMLAFVSFATHTLVDRHE